MNPSVECIEAIKKFESLRLSEYKDAAGYPTIGYGHLIPAGIVFDSPITEERANQILNDDVEKALAAVMKYAPATLKQGQVDALVDFCFNLGATALAMMLGHGIDQVPHQIVLWCHAGGKVLPGLVVRRELERGWWIG